MKNEAGGGGSLQGNELKLDDQCLSSLPGWVVETPRHAAVLKILYLNKNQFTRLPALLGLPHLEKLNMAGNSLSVIHAGVLPPSLLVLELINNQITTIEPGAFAALRKLRHLDLGANLLAGEALDGAAAELAGCRDLAVVDISCNRVRALPPSLVALPTGGGCRPRDRPGVRTRRRGASRPCVPARVDRQRRLPPLPRRADATT